MPKDRKRRFYIGVVFQASSISAAQTQPAWLSSSTTKVAALRRQARDDITQVKPPACKLE